MRHDKDLSLELELGLFDTWSRMASRAAPVSPQQPADGVRVPVLSRWLHSASEAAWSQLTEEEQSAA